MDIDSYDSDIRNQDTLKLTTKPLALCVSVYLHCWPYIQLTKSTVCIALKYILILRTMDCEYRKNVFQIRKK